jgi:glucose-6-phosphate 1-dehydrogenase
MCDDAAGAMSAYERLIGDALLGDPTLFARQDAIEAAWRIVDKVVSTVDGVQPMPLSYADGGWGPREAGALAADIGGWHDPGPGC